MTEVSNDAPPEIAAALEQCGLRPRHVVLVSPLKGSKGRRRAYRVEVEGGRTVKARQVDTPEEARRLLALRAGLEEAFAPALAQCDCVLLEEWIDGSPLTDLEAERWVEDGGALLGRLHARALAADVPPLCNTGRWVERGMSDVEILSGAGKLAAAEADALRAEIRRRDPGVARTALGHLDFCAENMLIDTAGRLRVIDNERMAIAPAKFDVARTFDRWPMSEAAWARFCRGYRSAAAVDDLESLGFWKILAVLLGARVRFQYTPARLDAALALLRRFAEGRGLSDPP
jgi:Ser/Thr protein kinase RdoA (MazF antagonist)